MSLVVASGGYSAVVVHRFPNAMASLVAELRFCASAVVAMWAQQSWLLGSGAQAQ